MKTEKAIFACGCFWGVQYQFDRANGVISTKVGYIGGKEKNPTYAEVKAHHTGHAEAVLVEYDTDITNFKELCQLFFEIHDPSQTDGQGPDIGPQYRSEIFYLNQQQKKESEEIIEILRNKNFKVFTKITPASEFWIAEDFHQKYYDKTGDTPYCHIRTRKF